MSNAEQWPDMRKECMNCAKRGVPVNDPAAAKCENPNSSSYGDTVGFWGLGCEYFVYPPRGKKVYLDNG